MFGNTMFPLSTFEDLRQEMNRLLDTRFNVLNGGYRAREGRFPSLNIWEDEDQLFVEAEVPGLSMEDIDLQVVGNELSISGQRKAMEGEGLTFHRQERGGGAFKRFITLPVEVDVDKVEATLKDGVLTVTLPKAAAAKARKISVKTS